MVILWEDLEAAAATGAALVVPVPGGDSCSLQVISVPRVRSLSLFARATWLCLLPPPAVSGLRDYSGLLAEEATAAWLYQ